MSKKTKRPAKRPPDPEYLTQLSTDQRRQLAAWVWSKFSFLGPKIDRNLAYLRENPNDGNVEEQTIYWIRLRLERDTLEAVIYPLTADCPTIEENRAEQAAAGRVRLTLLSEPERLAVAAAWRADAVEFSGVIDDLRARRLAGTADTLMEPSIDAMRAAVAFRRQCAAMLLVAK